MIKILVLGVPWKVYLYSAEQFISIHGALSAGLTVPELQSIFISENELYLSTVRHELYHAYLDSTCTSAAELTVEQFEEVNAELFAIHGEKMLKDAKRLYKELKNG